MEEWKEYRLGEIALGKGSYGIAAPAVPYDKSKYTYLRITDINDDGSLNSDGLKSVNDKNASKYLLHKGDIVFARTGNSTGRTYYYEGTEGPLVYAGFLIKFSLDSAKVNPRLLKYYTHSKPYYEWIHSFDTGATRGNINAQTFREMPIMLPPRSLQEKIVEILKSLDDKIELNRKINSNLEEQTKTIFQSWKKRIKELPHSSINLSEVARFIGGYSYKGNELQPSSQAMATIKNFERKGGFKVDGYKEIIPSEKIKQEQYAKVYDILVAHTDLTQNADVIGNAEMILSKGSHNRILFSMDLVKVEPKQNFPYRYFLIALLQDNAFKSHCLGYVNGTTVLHLSKKALPDFVFDIPTDRKLIEQINLLLSYYYQKRAEIMTESSDLASLRNVLLPRLMSGELVVR